MGAPSLLVLFPGLWLPPCLQRPPINPQHLSRGLTAACSRRIRRREGKARRRQSTWPLLIGRHRPPPLQNHPLLRFTSAYKQHSMQ